MNKPKMEVRGKHRQRTNVQPDDELKQILSGTNEEIAAAATSGVSAETIGEMRDSAGHTEQEIEAVVDAARADVAERLGVAPEAVVFYPLSLEDPSGTPVGEGPLSLEVKFDDRYSTHAFTIPPLIASKTPQDAPDGSLPASKQEEGVSLVRESAAAPAASVQKLMNGTDDLSMVAEIIRNASHHIHQGQVADMKLFVEDLTQQLMPYSGDIKAAEEQEDPEEYTAQNLKFVITRFPKGSSQVDQALLRQMLTTLPLAVTGFRSGFSLEPNGATRYRLGGPDNVVRISYQERKPKRYTHYYQDWGNRIALTGVTEANSFDFLALELSDDETQVLDAWSCMDMYPTELSGIDSGAHQHPRGRETWAVEIELGGDVRRGVKIQADAQVRWDDLHAQAV